MTFYFLVGVVDKARVEQVKLVTFDVYVHMLADLFNALTDCLIQSYELDVYLRLRLLDIVYRFLQCLQSNL